MPNINWSISETIALIFLAGFAVQQLLQILDPYVVAVINRLKTNMVFPDGVSDADFKKAVMSLLHLS